MARKGKRAALIVGNTYKSCEGLSPVPACKTSAENVKKALERRGFVCRLAIDVSTDKYLEMVAKFTEDNKDCEAILLYFCGHGGNEAFNIKTEGKVILKDEKHSLLEFGGNRGTLWEGGDFVFGEDGQKVLKDQILNKFAQANNAVMTKILIHDCCRSESLQAMGESEEKPFHVEIMRTDEANLADVHYQNVFLLHSTLPYQVAWCEKVSSLATTKFSKHFCAQLQMSGGVDISGLDVAINAELVKNGTKQMVEMT